MRTILHIQTRPEDELTRGLRQRQESLPDTHVEVIDLNGGQPDYAGLVEKIFAADSVEVF